MPKGRFPLKLMAALGAGTMLLAGCGGGGSSDSGASATATPSAPKAGATTAVSGITAADAVRLAKQGSFGPNNDLVTHIQSLGSVSAWLTEQFGLSGSNYLDLKGRAVSNNFCNDMAAANQGACNRDYMSSTPVAMEFYAHAIQNSDQLRQRVAWALSELIVSSDVEVHSTAGQATFNQILLDNAFGNYKDILSQVTLNPYMGDYLNLSNSSKSAPNENYARELMQLFSLGTNQLNNDGSLKTDSNGVPIPNYNADDVHNVARALTGWTWARFNNGSTSNYVDLDYTKPMVAYPAIYDTTAKSFLGVTVAANASQTDSLNGVINAIFNNASLPPYVSKFLIQQMVTSNPSAGYISRVTAAFINNGSGVRGDMKAVITAILTDAEARGDSKTGASDGKVKEPVLYATSIGRLIAGSTDGYAFTTRDAGMGQQPFRAPSVFNFYPPDYPLPLGNGLLSPPSKLMTVSTIINRHNLAFDWFVGGDSRGEYATVSGLPNSTGTQPNWGYWQGITDPGALADAMNTLMLNGSMTAQQRLFLVTTMTAVTNSDPVAQARHRAQTGLYIVATSPQFQVDR
jgi:hypothetical protein